MGVFYDDTKSRFLREGRAEGEIEGMIKGKIEGKIEGKIDSVISLMEKRGFTLEEAIDVIADSSDRDAIIEGVKLRVSS